jgi:hypothetical protein
MGAITRAFVLFTPLLGVIGMIYFWVGGLRLLATNFDTVRNDGVLQSMQPYAVPLYSCHSMAESMSQQEKENDEFAKRFVEQQCLAKQAGTATLIITNG